MKTIKKIFVGWSVTLLTASCSVQQFAVNTNTQHLKADEKCGDKKQKNPEQMVRSLNLKKTTSCTC